MLTVTEQAALALLAALQDGEAPLDQSIRVFARREADGDVCLRLAVDDIQADDKKVEFQDRIVLVAQPEVADLLDGRVLSIEMTAGRASFRLRPASGNGGDAEDGP